MSTLLQLQFLFELMLWYDMLNVVWDSGPEA